MPTHKSALKRMRQSEITRLRNRADRSHLRGVIKSFKALDEVESARTRLPKVVSIIDKSVKKGIIHPRKAARLKSKLSRKIYRTQ